MNVTKLPSGSYRVRLTHKKVNYSVVFDHKPTQTEVIDKISSMIAETPTRACMSFLEASQQYIDMKRFVLSPSTVREYSRSIKRFPKYFTEMDVNDITQIDMQKLINYFAKDKSPKSVKDYYCFAVSVIRMQNPSFAVNCTLPQLKINEPYIPTNEEVKTIINYTRENNPHYYVPIMLACWGLRRSEILGICANDLEDDNYLHIQRAIVEDENGNWITKNTKTLKSDRYIQIPDDVAELIRHYGVAYRGSPQSISNYLIRTEDKLGIKHFSIHKLRHYFASHLSELGVPDADILEMGGWNTDYVMKSRYRHAMLAKTKEGRKRISNLIQDSLT